MDQVVRGCFSINTRSAPLNIGHPLQKVSKRVISCDLTFGKLKQLNQHAGASIRIHMISGSLYDSPTNWTSFLPFKPWTVRRYYFSYYHSVTHSSQKRWLQGKLIGSFISSWQILHVLSPCSAICSEEAYLP